jgi:hypothetical protein
MKYWTSLATIAGILALGSWAPTTLADSNDAMCEVRKDGETKQKLSGPCTFSQRQGYIDLDMRNGETYSLAPGNKANNFKDQKGNKVTRTQASGNTQEFKWEGGRKIIVTFGPSSSSHGGSGGQGSAAAPKFKDLTGKNSIGAIDTMSERGFRDVDSIQSGDTQYGIFYHPASRLCVQLTMANNRVVSADDIKTHPKCH